MIEKRNRPPRSLPVANYGLAIARAVEWLGDRDLFAKSINSTHCRTGHSNENALPLQ
jgi:hypothetical protein